MDESDFSDDEDARMLGSRARLPPRPTLRKKDSLNTLLKSVRSQISESDRQDATSALNTLLKDSFAKTKYIATAGGGDAKVLIWDKQDLSMVAENTPALQKKQRPVEGVTSLCCVDKENHILAAGHRDKQIRVWNVEQGFMDVMEGSHDNAVTTLCTFRPDSARRSNDFKHLISGSDDKTLRLWKVDAEWIPLQQNPIGVCVSVLTGGHTRGIISVASCNKFAFSGSYDSSIAVWDMHRPDNRLVSVMKGHKDWIRCLVWHEFCNQLISASDDGSICMWDTRSGKVEQTMTGHSSFVYSMIIHSDGLLYTASEDRSIKKWDVRAMGSEVDTIKIHNSEVYNLCSVSDRYICAHSEDAEHETTEIKLIDVQVSASSLSEQIMHDSMSFISPRSENMLLSPTGSEGSSIRSKIEVASTKTGLQTRNDRWSRSLVLI